MSNIIEKVKGLLEKSFHCEGCGKKIKDNDRPKFSIYVEKWFEDEQAKSATQIKLCDDCAGPVSSLVKKCKAYAAMRKKEIEIDPHGNKKPYHFD